MQKILLILGAVCAVILTGCQAAYSVSDGYARTMPGVLVSNQTSGGVIIPKVESMADMEMLGRVNSSVSASNILMLVSFGDASIAHAKEEALRAYPQADDVVNVEIDIKHSSILSIYNTVTMKYTGIAIKYKK